MNFKELCEALIREGEGQVNGVNDFETLPEWPKAQAWIKRAYEQVQLEQPHWTFLFGTGKLFTTRSGVRTYLPIADVAEVDTRSLLLDRSGRKGALNWLPYEDWRALFASSYIAEGVPQWISRLPSGEFILAPAPNGAYMVTGDWWNAVSSFELNEDEPIWDSSFHEIIVWKALRFWAEENDVPSLRQRIAMTLPRMERAFILKYLPATRKPL